MKTSKNHPTLALALVLLATATTSALAQQMQPDTMPPGGMPPAQMPRPGSLNYVEGQVSSAGQALSPQSVGHFALQPNQSLETSADGYVEVLLTPGAFLRVGPNSALSLSAVGLADTRINLTRGNALIEIDQFVAIYLTMKFTDDW